VHRSRIGIVLIDHPADRYEANLAFWAGAAGRPAERDHGGPEYASLGVVGTLNLEVQRTGVGTPPRLHLDIETDDIEAEVARLTGLGASVERRPEGFVVMRDPGGLVFCVVGVQTGERFAADAVTWTGGDDDADGVRPISP
jgi:hypothetical protein